MIDPENLFELIKTRRCIRDFDSERQVDKKIIERIIEAGIWAPTASNVQPWEFIVVSEKNNVKKVKMVSPGIFSNPNTIVVLLKNMERTKRGGPLGDIIANMDIAMSAQNMMLMAHSYGIGSCPALSFSKEALKVILDIPDHLEPTLLLTLGYPKQKPRPPKRRNLMEVLHYEKYGLHENR